MFKETGRRRKREIERGIEERRGGERQTRRNREYGGVGRKRHSGRNVREEFTNSKKTGTGNEK